MAEEGVFAAIANHPALDVAASKAAGYEVKKDVPYITIRIRGLDKHELHQPVDENYKKRFPEAWEAYLKNEEVPIIGAPITNLPGLGPSMIDLLKRKEIHTIESLAVVSEVVITGLGRGAREAVENAKKYLSQSSTDTSQLEEENKKLQATLADTVRRLNTLENAAAPEKPKKPKRTLSPEHLAKLQAGRARAKEEKEHVASDSGSERS